MSQILTDLPTFLLFLRGGQHSRPRKDRHTAEQREENTVWMTQTTMRGIHRIRVVLWWKGGGGRESRRLVSKFNRNVGQVEESMVDAKTQKRLKKKK